MNLETYHLSLVDHAPLHMLLRPDGILPEVLDTMRTSETGSDQLVVSCTLGDQPAMLRYLGPTMIAKGPGLVATERARVERLREALDAYENELDAISAFFEGQ